MSQVHPQQHKQPTNTTTMVMEPLARGFDESTPSQWRAAMRIHFSKPLLKGLVKVNKLM
jgi:hypothetical protein